MGDWAETCFFSNLPIEDGESIVAFLLRTKPKRYTKLGDSMCYPDDLFDPISLPLRGTYDGYGRITLDDDHSDYNDYILKNTLYRSGSLKDSTNEELMQKFNAGVIEDNMYNYTKVFMKKSVYESVIDLAKQEIEPPFSMKLDADVEILSYFDDLRKIISNHYTNIEALKNIGESEASKIANLRLEEFMFQEREDDEYVLPPSVRDKFKVLLNRTLETSDDLQNAFCEFVLLNTLMGEARKTWSIPSGSGSHTENWSLMLSLNTTLANVIESEIAVRVEEYIEDEFGFNPEKYKESEPESYAEWLKIDKLDPIGKAKLVSKDF